MGRTVMITTYEKFLEYANDKTKDILSTYLVNEHLMLLQYKDAEGYEKPDGKGNIFVATFTTAHARIKLYNELAKLGDRALYYDTGELLMFDFNVFSNVIFSDSIIYIKREGEQSLVKGPLLGHLTCEITPKYGENAIITKFCAGGPKTYLLNIADKTTGNL